MKSFKLKLHIKRALTALGCSIALATPTPIMAEDNGEIATPASKTSTTATELPLLNLHVETRIDYQRTWIDGHTVKDNSGFEGKYLFFRADGHILPSLRYSWRQRLNKPHKDAAFFDATDWIYICYTTGRWSISGGKEVVAIGGWEYDRVPSDVYSHSQFWDNVACFQLGVSGAYKASANDAVTAQICQSPFFTSDNRNLYGYSLMWTGSHGIFDAMWSANLLEYRPGHYISYLSLGNRFTAGNACLELDIMNRAAARQTFFLRDMTVVADLSYRINSRWKLFGKMTYDVNHTHSQADSYVLSGTELTMAGGGVEYFPIPHSRHLLRLHANAFYAWGHNANPSAAMQNRTAILDVGFKLNLDLFTLHR